MTTITFESKIKIKKNRFKDINDFKNYIENNFYFTELKKVPKSKTPLEIMEKMKETKKLKKPCFVNI
ncbi:MAG: hypothetical protein AAB962_01640 [Patescibacteria group bacterium]|mgnify:CR=1 FL=1